MTITGVGATWVHVSWMAPRTLDYYNSSHVATDYMIIAINEMSLNGIGVSASAVALSGYTDPRLASVASINLTSLSSNATYEVIVKASYETILAESALTDIQPHFGYASDPVKVTTLEYGML